MGRNGQPKGTWLWAELQWLPWQSTVRTEGLQSAWGADTQVCLPVELEFSFWNKSFRKRRLVIRQQT